MSVADIVTGQFVQIVQTPASVGERIMARLLDGAVVVAYFLGMSYFFFRVLTPGGKTFLVTYIFLVLLPTMGYTFLCETFNHGQTLGKYVFKLRTVHSDGSQPTVGSLLIRQLLLTVDVGVSFVGLLFIICTQKRQRLGDLAAGTIVIRLASYQHLHVSLEEFYYARRDYRPVYPQASQLSVGQAEVIRKVLAGPDRDEGQQVDVLAGKIRRLFDIAPRQTDNRAFLTTLLHDYQFYALELL